jgi:hypothetical protein
MWPEAIVAALGGLGASAAYVAHKARNYGGGFSSGDIDRMNYRRNTTTPAWNSPDFNRREPPPTLPELGPIPSWYYQVGAPPPGDLAKERQKREGTIIWNPDGTWQYRESPGGTEPPPYDGPTGA